MSPRIRFAQHAEVVLRDREIARAWIEQTLAAPEWEMEDPRDPCLRLASAAIAERGGAGATCAWYIGPKKRTSSL
ncbi:hypothetical protein ABLE93_16460 [Xanthobacter sp. KR7-65]|uniref:hypothetical protein n=1 Tax=Xanthobacter sp. KR7-65 TaxID=3156612 RepID=UPI0032B547EC